MHEELTDVLLHLARTLDRLRRTTEVVRVLEEAQRVGPPEVRAWLAEKQAGWELLARLFLAFDDPAYLDRAIVTAGDTEPIIRRLLVVVRSGHDDDVMDIVNALPAFNARLLASGRRAEAITVKLLGLWMINRQMRFADRWSPTERPLILGADGEYHERNGPALRRAERCPCRARFLFARATAILHSLRGATPAAIQDLEEAATIYRGLVRRDPDFRFALGGVLQNLGIAYRDEAITRLTANSRCSRRSSIYTATLQRRILPSVANSLAHS